MKTARTQNSATAAVHLYLKYPPKTFRRHFVIPKHSRALLNRVVLSSQLLSRLYLHRASLSSLLRQFRVRLSRMFLSRIFLLRIFRASPFLLRIYHSRVLP